MVVHVMDVAGAQHLHWSRAHACVLCTRPAVCLRPPKRGVVMSNHTPAVSSCRTARLPRLPLCSPRQPNNTHTRTLAQSPSSRLPCPPSPNHPHSAPARQPNPPHGGVAASALPHGYAQLHVERQPRASKAKKAQPQDKVRKSKPKSQPKLKAKPKVHAKVEPKPRFKPKPKVKVRHNKPRNARPAVPVKMTVQERRRLDRVRAYPNTCCGFVGIPVRVCACVWMPLLAVLLPHSTDRFYLLDFVVFACLLILLLSATPTTHHTHRTLLLHVWQLCGRLTNVPWSDARSSSRHDVLQQLHP